MSARDSKRAFVARPSDAEAWVRKPDPIATGDGKGDVFTARLTIDVTPKQRGRIKVVAFQRGLTVADMLRELLARGISRQSWRSIVIVSDIATELTHVELTWREKRIEHWIRFGNIAAEKVLDRRRRIVSFTPGDVFAFVRWASNGYGTIISRVDIVRAVWPGEAFSTLPFVRPGGDILLRVTGWPKVERVLQTVDAMEAAGIDPVNAAPDHWRHVHNRLTAGEEPRHYTPARHSAWLLRQRAEA